MVDITCLSDLHGHFPKDLPGGDLLIVAGDLTARDTHAEYLKFFHWIANTPYKKRIVIAGNHDNLAQNEDILNIAKGDFEYLCDSGTEFCGTDFEGKSYTMKIWGSPWSLTFPGMNPKCKAFTVDSEEELYDKFIQIPHDTDILITHSPAFGILDQVPTDSVKRKGSKSLYSWLKYVERPKLHVFGHIHESYGVEERLSTYNDKMMLSVNASHVNEYYKPVNKPIRVIL